MNLKKWKILNSEYVFETKWFKIRKDRVVLPDGTVYSEYFIKERSDWGALFCITKQKEFILLKTYKHGSKSFIYELPSGSIDDGETPEQGIRRELLEETGYNVDEQNLQKLGELLVDPTYTQAKMHLFFAYNAEKTAVPENNPREIFEILFIPIEKAEDFILENMNCFPESQTAAILLLKSYIERKENIRF